MDDLYALGARCLERVIAYHYDIDRGAATNGLAHFAEDAVFEAHGQRYVGREGIMAFLKHREAQTERQTVHVITGPRFSRAEDGSIFIGALALINVRNVEGQYTVNRVLDMVHRFAETTEGWLIAERRSKPLHRSITP